MNASYERRRLKIQETFSKIITQEGTEISLSALSLMAAIASHALTASGMPEDGDAWHKFEGAVDTLRDELKASAEKREA